MERAKDGNIDPDIDKGRQSNRIVTGREARIPIPMYSMAKYALRWTEKDEQKFMGNAEEVLQELRVYAHSAVHWEAIQKVMADLEVAKIGAVATFIDYTVEKIG